MKNIKCIDKTCKINEKKSINRCKCGAKIQYICKCCNKWISHQTFERHKQRMLINEIKKLSGVFNKISNLISDNYENNDETEDETDEEKDVPEENTFNIKDWLKSINMKKYINVFIKNGWDNILSVKILNSHELDLMNVKKEHAIHILHHINKLNNEKTEEKEEYINNQDNDFLNFLNE